MQLGSLKFRPGRWPALITLMLFGVLLSLGFWQLDRADQKRALLKDYRTGSETALLELDARLKSAAGLDYQLAGASGYYDGGHQFLLDNQIHQGVAGYQVLTPLKLRGAEVAVLVNRGWVPLGTSRQVLPPVAVAGDERKVTGRIKRPALGGFKLGEEQIRRRWPYRIQHVDLDKLAGELGYPLLPVVLLLDPQQPDGFVRDWHPLYFGPERNVGYAVQWFTMAAVLIVIFLAVNLRKSGED